MSYGAELKYWEWGNDASEMAAAAAQGLEISNHSYGPPGGWEKYNGNWSWRGNTEISPTEDYYFGFYNNESRQMDQIAFNAPYYLMCRSAGNERGEGPSYAGTDGYPEIDGGTDGYDCISPVKLSKNILSVGAVREVVNYSKPDDVVMSSFSSWGPVDDGRIKPDIVGKGVSVYSTMDGSNTSYSTLNGTSMSTPNVVGTLALLQKYYQDTHGDSPMRSATLKGLAIHTADEAGDYPGPDYIFGWGLMNAKKAALLISDDVGQVVIDELLLSGGDIYTREINVPEGVELRITICWTDPPGIPVSQQLNPRDPMLVNDLDLKITDDNTNDYFPYKLDPENPTAAATTDSKNAVDNVESVYIAEPEAGTYTITVTHDGSLEGDEQAFSIIISGIDEYTVLPECSAGMESPEDGAAEIYTNQWFSWVPADFASSYDVYFGTDGGGTVTPTSIYNGENFPTNGFSTLMNPGTTYYLQVVPRNNMGPSTACNTIYTFTTLEAITEFPYLQSMTNVELPKPPAYWQTVDNTDATAWLSTDLITYEDNRGMMCWNTEGIFESDYDNWFISPPFEVAAGNEYSVSSYYRGFSGSRAETLYLYWGTTPYTEDLTNLLYEDVDFKNTTWQQTDVLYIPEADGLVYFGWKVASTNGFGIFLDEILVDNWGTVGIGNGDKAAIVSVYNRANKVIVEAGESWNGANLKIMNTMGQIMYSGLFFKQASIELKNPENGLYIVSLQKGSQVETKKLILQ
jgi:hypothetical protein